MHRGLRSFRTQLGVVALFAWAIRLVAVLAWSQYLTLEGDQNFYWRQAQALAKGYGFVYRNNYGEYVSTAVHPPLHTAYLALAALLPMGEQSSVQFRLACTLLGLAAVVVIGLAARRVAGDRAGVIAAFLAAIYPNLWISDAMMLSESMYALTIGLVVLAAAAFWHDRTPRHAAFLGGAVALATLTRAEAAFLVVLLIVPLALWGGDRAWRDRLRNGAVAIGVAGAVVAPWVVRNFVTFDSHPVTISNGSGFVVEISNCDPSYGLAPDQNPDGSPKDEPADKYLGYWAPSCDRTPWPAGDETVVGAAKGRTGTDYIKAHKRRFPVVVAARVGRIWDVWRPAQSYQFNLFFERRGDYPTRLAMALYYPMGVLSLTALWILHKRRRTVIPYLAIFAMTTLTAAVSFGITRYRVGADVAITVLAAVAIDAFLRRWWPVPEATGTTDPGATDVGSADAHAARPLVGAATEGAR